MIKRSIVINGHATSIRLEAEFWQALDNLCKKYNLSLAQFINKIETQEQPIQNLASHLRVRCLQAALSHEI